MTALADRTFRDLLEAFAAPAPTPGGGSAAALAAAAAAALLERCASAAPATEFAHARARAGALRRELVLLADSDSVALASLVDARRSHPSRLGRAAADASAPPALLRVGAVELTELAASLAQNGRRSFRGEARCAMLLADAAARMAGTIIALNLRLGDPGS